MLKLYDTVTLKQDRDDIGVKASYRGAVVDVLGNGAAYTVEFFDENNNGIKASIFTEFTEDDLIKVD